MRRGIETCVGGGADSFGGAVGIAGGAEVRLEVVGIAAEGPAWMVAILSIDLVRIGKERSCVEREIVREMCKVRCKISRA